MEEHTGKDVEDFHDALIECGEEEDWEKWAEEEKNKNNRIQLKGYREFMCFLHDDCVFKTDAIMETIAESDRIEFLGYVDGELSVKNNELKITVEVPDKVGFGGREKCKITCDWQYADNYAVHQRCEFEDSYYGWIIIPCWNFKRFYCLYYTC